MNGTKAMLPVVLLLLVVQSIFGQTQISGTFQPSVDGGLPYTLLIPNGYDAPGANFPLMVHLEPAPIELSSVLRGDEYPAYLLSASRNGRSWSSATDSLSFNASLLVELMEQLESEYASIDTDRRFISGWSVGAFGTFDLIAKRPDLFDAAVPIAGGSNPTRVSPSVRTWAFHGREDGVVSPYGSRIMVNAIHEAGGSPLYLEFVREAHDIQDDVLSMPEVYDWLFHETPPSLPRLVYNSTNGNLKLDARPTPMWTFSIRSSLEMKESLLTEIDGISITSNSSTLRYRPSIDTEFDGNIDFGEVLPAGLNYVTFHEAIRGSYRPTGENVNRDFIVQIVPEPRYDGVFPLLALLALSRRCRSTT